MLPKGGAVPILLSRLEYAFCALCVLHSGPSGQ